ncbi:DEP domain-containing protein 1B [Amphibalanus amphitrite]|uniref:DEP domain-containing protein 1B n=1 Tax=Amphibalanus amphitrite TaxID=1232801 RepID=A0A6A4WXB1_AMPAM|nr:DEP domain-containing protein 1B [Amphibalanus amphitrite]
MESNNLGSTEGDGPYKATQLWREAVRGFREGMVLQRHWRNLRYHERCFTGAAAVSWLHRYLAGHALFSANVSREQTVRLLAKFVQAGIIQEVRGRRGTAPPEFKDDGRLYRASPPPCTEEPPQQHQPPPPPPPLPLPQCRPVMRAPTAAEVDSVWSATLLSRLETVLDATVVDIVPAGCVVPAWIRHNTERVTQSGLVQPLPDAPPSLPRWLIMAMKTLANWPEARQMPELPQDYVDFQLDVFRVIREYFAALPFPLVPHELYESLVGALLRAEQRDRQLRDQQEQEQQQAQRRRQSTAPAGSVENLLLMMSPAPVTPRPPADTPLLGSAAADGRYRDFKEDSLFASPAPVTPAGQSVARLRGRLMRLGVGAGAAVPAAAVDAADTTEDDVFATPDEEPRRRPRAASFLRAIADGKENCPPAERDQERFCEAVFRPPVEAAPGQPPARLPTVPTLSTVSLPVAGFFPSTSSLQPARYVPTASLQPPARPYSLSAASPHSLQASSADSSPAQLSLTSGEYYLTSSRLEPAPSDASVQSAGRLSTGRPRRSVASIHSVGSAASLSSARLSVSGLSQASPLAGDSSRGSDSAVGSSLASERPADTCLETVFGATGPVTRLIPQRSVEALHLPASRPGSRLSEAAPGSSESLSSRGRAPGVAPAAIRRHQLRDDSLSRSLRRLKEKRRDKQEQRRRREQAAEQPPPAAAAAVLGRRLRRPAAPAASALKAARVLGLAVEQVEQVCPPPPPVPARAAPVWRGPAALRVWQRRSVADPSRVSQPLSPLQQAARQRHSVVGRDYENLRDLSRLMAEPAPPPAGPPPPKPARAPYQGRFRATPCKRVPLLAPGAAPSSPGTQGNWWHALPMVSTFADRILRAASAEQADPELERRLVSYLLEHQAEILAPPGHVRDAVAERLRQRPRETVQYEEDTDQITFCQRVTAEQYDQERRGTSGSLLSLLDTIIGDTRMSKKDKIKRLRQFREVYPDVYALRLAEADQQLAADPRRTRSLFAAGSLTSLVRSKSLRF